MVSELARVVAFAFRTQGRASMTRVELKQLLSLRLNWYRPADASQVLEGALRAGLLVEEGEVLRPGFALEDVELPLGFRGTLAALEEPLPAEAEARAPAPPDPGLVERARALRELAKGRLSEEASLLLARRERGEDVTNAAAEALSRLSPPR